MGYTRSPALIRIRFRCRCILGSLLERNGSLSRSPQGGIQVPARQRRGLVVQKQDETTEHNPSRGHHAEMTEHRAKAAKRRGKARSRFVPCWTSITDSRFSDSHRHASQARPGEAGLLSSIGHNWLEYTRERIALIDLSTPAAQGCLRLSEHTEQLPAVLRIPLLAELPSLLPDEEEILPESPMLLVV